MANYKRRKPRRKCRCTLCTQLRWLGNKKARINPRDAKRMEG